MISNKTKRIVFPALFVFFLIVSCTFDNDISIRAFFEHRFGDSLYIDVVLEGKDGISLNGASVVVYCPDSQALLLDYDGDSCRYKSSVYSPVSGVYSINAVTNSADDGIGMDISFSALQENPVISDVSDSNGNSASLGDDLDQAYDLMVSSNTVTGATHYALSIFSSTSTVYSASATSPSFVIPSGICEAGVYTAVLEAQSIAGDPLLLDEDYYAVSSSVSGSFVFSVQ